jgi:primosomal protein N'
LYILNPFLPKTDAGIFINFDFSMHSSNPFLKEKYLRILNDLKNSVSDLYLHSNLPEETLEKIKNFSILKEIIEERKNQKLPPFYKVVKLISRLRNLELLNKRLLQAKELLNKNKLFQNVDIEIYGPFLERIPMKIKRFQLFLLLKTKGDINLKKLLEGVNYIEEIRADEEEI